MTKNWNSLKEIEFEKAIEEFKKLHLRLPTLEEESELWEAIYNNQQQIDQINNGEIA